MKAVSFYDFRQCRDLFELADRLEELIEYTGSCKNKNRVLKDLFDEINRYMFFSSLGKGSCRIWQGREGLLVFLINYWECGGNYKQNVENIRDIINLIRTKMGGPTGNGIPVKQIVCAAAFLEERFQFISKIIGQKRLDIVLLDHTYDGWMSYYSPAGNTILFTDRAEECRVPPYCTIFHEFGHVLHTMLMEEALKVPDSFYGIKEEILAGDSPLRTLEDVELFATFFEIAAAAGTPLADDYKFGTPEQKEKIAEYMEKLINRTI